MTHATDLLFGASADIQRLGLRTQLSLEKSGVDEYRVFH
jgi:hypothetical protein